MPDSTQVAGFSKWKELGRSVKKDAKGIRIIAPIVRDEAVQCLLSSCPTISFSSEPSSPTSRFSGLASEPGLGLERRQSVLRSLISNAQITSRNFLVVAAIVISEEVPGHRDLGVGGGLLLGIHRCLWGRDFLLLR